MMAFGASMDVLGGVVTRVAPRAASSVPGRACVGVRVGVLDGVMARATLLDIRGCMHAYGRALSNSVAELDALR